MKGVSCAPAGCLVGPDGDACGWGCPGVHSCPWPVLNERVLSLTLEVGYQSLAKEMVAFLNGRIISTTDILCEYGEIHRAGRCQRHAEEQQCILSPTCKERQSP